MIFKLVSFGIALCAMGFAVFACLVEPGATSGTLFVVSFATLLLTTARPTKRRTKIAPGLLIVLMALAAFSVSRGAFACTLAASLSLIATTELLDRSLRRDPESGRNLEST